MSVTETFQKHIPSHKIGPADPEASSYPTVIPALAALSEGCLRSFLVHVLYGLPMPSTSVSLLAPDAQTLLLGYY